MDESKNQQVSIEYITEMISRVSFFKDAPRSEMEYIAKLLKQCEVPKGGVIIKQHDVGDSMYFIDSGEVDVLYETEAGEKRKVAILHEGDFLGEMALIHDEPRTATCMADANCVLYELKASDLKKVKEKCPSVHSAIAQAARMRKVELLHPYYFEKLRKREE